MEWKDVGSAIIKIAPSLGAVLGGPAGGAVGVAAAAVASALGLGANASPDDVLTAIGAMTPDTVVKLKSIDQQMQAAQLSAEQSELESVNKTMQTEAASEHWPSYSWRPFIGFMFGLYIASLWLLPLFGKQAPKIDTDTVLAIGGILGVASWFRGKAQADPRVQTDNRG